jgi:phosphatidylglycerol:prolipoprotein diacylglycerol transferase
MQPILFEVPGLGLIVTGFGVMFLLACSGALMLTAWRARKEGIDPDAVYELAIWIFFGGVVGARVVYVIQNPDEMRSVADLFRVWRGGIVFYGCIFGGLIGTMIAWRRKPFPFLKMADAVAPALAWGAGIGRLGCFLNGCCHGTVSESRCALTFPAGSIPWYDQVAHGLIPPDALRSLPVHPAQLYAAGTAIALLVVMLAYHSRRRFDGEVMTILMVGYAMTRFWVEGLRGDQPTSLLGLTFSQIVSLVLLGFGVGAWLWLATLNRRRPDRARLVLAGADD